MSVYLGVSFLVGAAKLRYAHLVFPHARRRGDEEARDAVDDGCAALEALAREEESTEELVACMLAISAGGELTNGSDSEQIERAAHDERPLRLREVQDQFGKTVRAPDGLAQHPTRTHHDWLRLLFRQSASPTSATASASSSSQEDLASPPSRVRAAVHHPLTVSTLDGVRNCDSSSSLSSRSPVFA